MRLIDSHCHLNYAGLVERQDEVLDSARARGRWRASSTSPPGRRSGATILATAERHDDVWASVGVHPHEADAHPDLGAAALVEGSEHAKVIAIGECGLDYYYDKSRPPGPARAVRGAYRGGADDRPAADRPHPRRGGGHGRDPRRAR